MTSPAFDPNDDRLTAYALGELCSADRAEFEQVLAASAELRQELADLQSLAVNLHADLSAEFMPSLLTEQHRALLDRAVVPAATECPVAVAAPLSQQTVRRRRSRGWVEVAACMALLIGIAVYLGSPGVRSHEDLAGDSLVDGLQPRIAKLRSGVPIGRRHDSSTSVAQTEFTELVGEFDELMTSKRYVEAEVVAKKAIALNPSDPAATTMFYKSRIQRRAGAEGLVASKEESFWKQLDDGEVSASVVVSDGAPVTFGDNWSDIKVRSLHTVDNLASGVVALSRLSDQPELAYRFQESKPQSDETYRAPAENVFLTPTQQPLSTFSIDVDSASYSNIRRFLTQGQLPPADAVRVEEMVNYFHYDYPRPKEGDPFSVTADAAPCPWQRRHYLARIGLQARSIDKAKRPPTNLVFLLDVSGSMQAANKLPLVKQAMTMLAEELNERDRIAIVTYAGDAGVKLPSTSGQDQVRVMQAIEALQAGGSTNGAAGINLAYEEALRSFTQEGENRVILCTDGDFNVGVSDDEQLVQLITQQAKTKVFLSIFGFGMGNLKDAKLEQLADKGNGHYGYIDDLREARRVFNEELVGTLYTVAKDVKIQVEFNPLTVGAYRLIGYENRALAARDFNDDTKDAGEIGAGHTVTALYEIVPKGQWPKTQAVDPLKYGNAAQEPPPVVDARKTNLSPESSDDLFTVKLRYKQPNADTSVKTIDHVVDDIAGRNVVPSADMLWAASVAAFGMQLKQSQFRGEWSLHDIFETAQSVKGPDANGRRREFLDLVQTAIRLSPPTAREPKKPAVGF